MATAPDLPVFLQIGDMSQMQIGAFVFPNGWITPSRTHVAELLRQAADRIEAAPEDAPPAQAATLVSREE